MKFTKMQGIGNDYIYVNCFEEKVDNPNEMAIKLSSRHFGVGGDGLILICPSDTCDIKMRMFNADGSEGNMCGNGARCVARYAYDYGIVKKECITLETLAGMKELKLNLEDKKVVSVTVDMGIAVLTSEMNADIEVDGKKLKYTGADIGNPHAVYFLSSREELDNLDLDHTGRFFEKHEFFSEGVNSEFIWVENKKNLFMRVWERGSGETLACGTGATASAYTAMSMKLCDETVTVHLLGGDLEISRDKENGHMYMTGPAKEVFRGEVDPDDL